MNANAHSNLIERIRALRAKAEGTDNEHEAETFAAKVAELLARHNLAEVDIADEDEEPIAGERWNTMYNDPWRRAIVMQAARLYMCSAYSHFWWDKFTQRKGMTFVGRAHNIVVAKEMSEYLISTTVRLARGYSKERGAQLGFERGCGLRLASRLAELHKAQTEGPRLRTSQGNPGNLPALYDDEDALLKAYMDQLGLTHRKSHTKLNVHSSHGAIAANNVSLATQIGTPNRANALPNKKGGA